MSLAELLLIAVVALLVLGPHDFFRLLRTGAACLARWRRLWAHACFAVRQQLDRDDRARYHDHHRPPPPAS